MIREGVLAEPKPDAIFGLHVMPFPAGRFGCRSGPLMASVDFLSIVIRGQQTHGALPWRGVDPIVVASQVVVGLQTVCEPPSGPDGGASGHYDREYPRWRAREHHP